mgnify:FL=1
MKYGRVITCILIAAYPFKSDHRLSYENGNRGSDAGNSAGVCFFGWKALLLVCLSVATCVATEGSMNFDA